MYTVSSHFPSPSEYPLHVYVCSSAACSTTYFHNIPAAEASTPTPYCYDLWLTHNSRHNQSSSTTTTNRVWERMVNGAQIARSASGHGRFAFWLTDTQTTHVVVAKCENPRRGWIFEERAPLSYFEHDDKHFGPDAVQMVIQEL